MKLEILKYKTIHIISLLSAIGVHGTILASSLSPSDPIVLNKQTINISFVAPSAQNNKNSKISKKEDIAFEVKEKESLNSKKKIEEAKKESEKQEIAGNETSGKVHKDATALLSAESEPVFDVEYLNNPVPYYPSQARRKGIAGKVLLDVVVKIDGMPENIKISQSSGSSILDNAALDAVKKWRFIPAKKSGKLVEANVIVPIEFKII